MKDFALPAPARFAPACARGRRIAFVTTGDIEDIATSKRAFGMAGPLAALGHEVAILMQGSPANRARHLMEAPAARMEWFPAGPALAEMRAKRRALARLAPDIVYVGSYGLRNLVAPLPPCRALFVVEHSELPSAITTRPAARRLADAALERLALRAFRGQVCASGHLLDLVRARLPAGQGGRAHYSAYGYSPHMLLPGGAPAPRGADGLRRVLYMGTLARNYGIFHIMEAMARLAPDMPEARLVVLGKGRHFAEARAHAAALGIARITEFRGYVPEDALPQHLAEADAFVAPVFDTVQDIARCPSKLFMYLPFGRPIVTSPVGEARALFGADYPFHFAPADVEAMAGRLRAALETPEDWSASWTAEDHTWQARAEAFDAWLAEMTEARAAPGGTPPAGRRFSRPDGKARSVDASERTPHNPAPPRPAGAARTGAAEGFDAERLTHGPAHHFFGFHDLTMTSRETGLCLGLSVPRIDRPPMGQDSADVIVWDSEQGFAPRILTRTRCFNFPQGARQHWLGGTATVIVNETDCAGRPVAGLYDAGDGTRIGQIGAPVSCTDAAGARAFGVDFGRAARLGGYGHAGIPDRTPDQAAPAANGLFVTDIAADDTRLMLSIAELAQRAGIDPAGSGAQYLTHPRLSPTGRRIAFLHRFRLADGGEETCLWTAGTDGAAPHLLARGFLSHFDWTGEDALMIWGRRGRAVAALRRSALASNPLARAILPAIKAPLRALAGRSPALAMGWLRVEDRGGAAAAPFAAGVLTADGHPMRNPVFPDWLTLDTYPDAAGMRALMLYHLPTGRRTDLGRYAMSPARPAPGTVADTARWMRGALDVAIDPALYAFTRSGLHCDLHPRWSGDGRAVLFDSIHEGTRQVYRVDVARVVAP